MITLEKSIKIIKMLKKTKAKGFKEVKVGDVLELSLELDSTTGASGNGLYASYVGIKNKDYEFGNSMNQLVRNLWCFDYEELPKGGI